MTDNITADEFVAYLDEFLAQSDDTESTLEWIAETARLIGDGISLNDEKVSPHFRDWIIERRGRNDQHHA